MLARVKSFSKVFISFALSAGAIITFSNFVYSEERIYNTNYTIPYRSNVLPGSFSTSSAYGTFDTSVPNVSGISTGVVNPANTNGGTKHTSGKMYVSPINIYTNDATGTIQQTTASYKPVLDSPETIKPPSVVDFVESTIRTLTPSPQVRPPTAPVNARPSPLAAYLYLPPGLKTGVVSVQVDAKDALSVEINLIRGNSPTPIYLGNASRLEGSQIWTYSWDTSETPNGFYIVYAIAKFESGIVESNRVNVSVDNRNTFTLGLDQNLVSQKVIEAIRTETEEEKRIQNQVREIKNEIVEIALKHPGIARDMETPVLPTLTRTFVKPTTTTDTERNLERVVNRILNRELSGFSEVPPAPSGSEQVPVTPRASVTAQKINEVIRREIGEIPPEKEQILNELKREIEVKTEELALKLSLHNEVIKKRAGINVFLDRDLDDISDYDEVNLYRTDPFIADSDGDGTPDGVEVFSGFNPTKAETDVKIIYEDPREKGEIDRERLKVLNVEFAPQSPKDTKVPGKTGMFATDRVSESRKIIFSGQALPNSFVTIYIYSTLIVVTVKTDNDGNWFYILDKELPDGSHDVYVAITDNAGKIVAKSEKFSFVKQAQALTITENPNLPLGKGEIPGLFSGKAFNLSMFVILALLALAVIGVSFRKSVDQEENLPPPA